MRETRSYAPLLESVTREEPHYHIWTKHPRAMFMVPRRFRTVPGAHQFWKRRRAKARAEGRTRSKWEAGYRVFRCELPCPANTPDDPEYGELGKGRRTLREAEKALKERWAERFAELPADSREALRDAWDPSSSSEAEKDRMRGRKRHRKKHPRAPRCRILRGPGLRVEIGGELLEGG